ncbi:MAG: hypothetical protein HKM93_00060 [Desulfobacteraceae bacterium]|nr:hypothetical protein [Desulfobacteraceae bacterium]
MMGTFAAMLAKEKIATPDDRYQADVTGDIEDVDGILKIVRINVKYKLKITAEKKQKAEAAFGMYLPHCPAAQSVVNCIDISHDLDLVEI